MVFVCFSLRFGAELTSSIIIKLSKHHHSFCQFFSCLSLSLSASGEKWHPYSSCQQFVVGFFRTAKPSQKDTCPARAEHSFFEKVAFYGIAVCFKVDLL